MADSDSTPGKAPAFQFYPKDFLTDERVALMSMQERGVYITLICKCWTEGTLPQDATLLARLCGMPPAAFRKLWPAIAPCFRACARDADRLIHPRLEKERQKQRAFRRRQADNGRKGGRPPQSGKPKDNPSLLQTGFPKESSAFAISDLQSASPHSSGKSETGARTGMGSGVMAGSLHRDHLGHEFCGRVCVPRFLHGDFVRAIGGDNPVGDVQAFYASVMAQIPESQSIGDDPIKFWRAQFAAKYGTTTGTVNPKTAGNAAAAARFVARRQG